MSRGNALFSNGDRLAAGSLPRSADPPPQRGGVVFLAKLRTVVRLLRKALTPFDMRATRALRSESVARVGLNSNEVVVPRQVEEPVADSRVEFNLTVARLGAVLVLKVGQCKGHPDRDVCP